MKTNITVIFLAVAALFLGACSTPDSRIRRNQAAFDKMTPAEQASIRQGIVELGFTPEMVYLAMGRADNVEDRVTPTGTLTIWVYNRFFREYVGRQMVGFRRDVYFDPRINSWRVFYTPVSQPVFRERVEEIARIVFRDGRVESIEQVQ
jgi:hypothetical protein